MIDAFAKHGFEPYRLNKDDGEWWHFDYKNWERSPRIDTSFETLHWLNYVDNNPSLAKRGQAILDPFRKRDEWFYQDVAIFLEEYGDDPVFLNRFIDQAKLTIDGLKDGNYRPVFKDTFLEMWRNLPIELKKKFEQLILEPFPKAPIDVLQPYYGASFQGNIDTCIDMSEKKGDTFWYGQWMIKAWAVCPEFFKALNQYLPSIPDNRLTVEKSRFQLLSSNNRKRLLDILSVLDAYGDPDIYKQGMFYRSIQTHDLIRLDTAYKHIDDLAGIHKNSKYSHSLTQAAPRVARELSRRRASVDELKEEIRKYVEFYSPGDFAYLMRCLTTWGSSFI